MKNANSLFLLAIPVIFSLFSCQYYNNLEQLQISDTERNGLESAASALELQIFYKENIKSSSLEGYSHEAELQLDSMSKILTRFKDHWPMLANNSAALFYQQLTPEESKSLTAVKVSFPVIQDERTFFTYQTTALDTLAMMLDSADRFKVLFKKKDYGAIWTMVQQQPDVNEIQAFVKTLEKTEATHGQLEGFIPLGFKFYKTTSGQDMARYFMYLSYPKIVIQCHLDFLRTEKGYEPRGFMIETLLK